ncbi:CHAT domain-containing protein [Dactylosporangium sp. NPDC000521]|uniref:CHAT domain-containing protein n=1 Tax=Dactylosporangium sp. NPDC000521 TaxID=3363975 RepID=UPI003676E35F
MRLPWDDGDIEELLASLRARIRALETVGDGEPVLDPEGTEEAEELWHAVSFLEPAQLLVATVIGRLHWYRYLLLPEGEQTQDLVSGEFLTGFVRERAPQLLPELVHPLVGYDGPGPAVWLRQGSALLHQGLVERPAVLDRAIDLLRRATAERAGPPTAVAAGLSNLGAALQDRYRRGGNKTDLDESIEHLWRAVATAESDDHNLAGYLGNLCASLCMRYERGDADRGDLDAAIEAGERAAALVTDDHPWRESIHRNLRSARRLRDGGGAGAAHSRRLSSEDLSEVGELGVIGLRLAMGSTNPRTLEQAIDLLRMATAVDTGHPNLATYFSRLAVGLGIRYERERRRTDLDGAVAAAQRALELTPAGDAERPERLINASNTWQLRYEVSGQVGDLDARIGLLREAVELDPDPSMPWANLSNALLIRFQSEGHSEDLDATIEAARRANDLLSKRDSDTDRALALSCLSDALFARFERSGLAQDLDDAAALARQAVEALPDGHPQAGRYVADLARFARLRFARTGAMADLDDMIVAYRRSAQVTPDSWADKLRGLSSLATQLLIRYDRTGVPDDLSEAVAAAEQAVACESPDPGLQAEALTVLSIALRHRHRSVAASADLDRAILVAQRAARVVPAGERRGPVLDALANALFMRYMSTNAIADLDEVVAVRRAVLATRAEGAAPDGAALHNLSVSLRFRFERTGDVADLDEAIEVGRAAADVVDHDPGRESRLWTLGITLRTRFDHLGDRRVAQEAITLWQRVCGDVAVSLQTRIYAARDWGRMGVQLGDWPGALAGYTEAIRLLPLLAWWGKGRAANEDVLGTMEGLAGEAAAAAVNCDRPDDAVRLLEQGRTVLWSQLLDTRTDLDAVWTAAPELAREMVDIRAVLDANTDDATADSAAEPQRADAGQRFALASRWQEIVAEVRQRPGLEHFLLPPALDTLLPPPDTGPVVMVYTSPWRCDALVVRHSGVHVVPLRALTAADADQHLGEYLDALGRSERERTAAARLSAEIAVNDLLGWAWDTIAEPVLAALDVGRHEDDGRPWPRLWWCPSGQLQLVPIHAAGKHEQPGEAVLDRVVSSYTPGLRALARARTDPRTPDTAHDLLSGERLLIVAMPTTGDDRSLDLPEVRLERDHLISLLPSDRWTLLEGTDATRSRVLAALGDCGMVHFSCHGQQNPQRPSDSGVVLDDGTLTVADIANAPHDRRLAVLSACKTATVGTDVADEVVTLAAALHYSGWRHVVATLWSVWADAAADITCDLYTHAAAGGRLRPDATALALHEAIRHDREHSPDHPTRWAPFVHIGP